MTRSQPITLPDQRLTLSRKDAADGVDTLFDTVAGLLEADRRVDGMAKRPICFKTSTALRKRVDTHETLDHPPALP
ncbi:MAG: hypothetical protein HQL88_04295 [Magnetococcales bacterium]|nr:hypothetical protein [Magnetococcales bacterium]